MAVTLDDAYEFLQTNRLFNLEIIGDIILDKKIPTYRDIFTNNQTSRYLKFMVVEAGLGGLFMYRTPREYLEGFLDPTLWTTSQQPVYNGGDQISTPFLTINSSPATPSDNLVTYFTGTDDYTQTRRLAKWVDKDFISMRSKDYLSLYTLDTAYPEPWAERVWLDGTDGMQFHPNI